MQKRFTHNAFMSYSHQADRELAAALQRDLHRFAKPWYRLRAVNVFRDCTNLTVEPELWPVIERALASSEYFLFMASAAAKQSPWVAKELAFWLGQRDRAKLLLIVTTGELTWSWEARDFLWNDANPLPEILRGQFPSPPLYVDFSEIQASNQLSLSDPVYRTAVARIAAKLHGRSLEEIDGEDLSQHKRTMALTRLVLVLLSLLTLTAGGLTAWSLHQNGLLTLRNREITSQRDTIREQKENLTRELADSRVSQGTVALLNHEPHKAILYLCGARALAVTPHFRAAALQLQRPAATYRGKVVCPQPIRAVCFSPDGTLLATGHDGEVHVRDAATGKEVRTPLRQDVLQGVIAFSPDGALLAVAEGSAVRLCSPRTEGQERLLKPPAEETAMITSLAFSPDGKSLAVGLSANAEAVVIWDVALGKPVRRLGVHLPESLAFSPDGSLLAVGQQSGSIVLWSLATGDRFQTLDGHRWYARAVAFSPDGKLLLSGGFDHQLRLWGLKDGKQIREFLGHTDNVDSVAFSPDGRIVASSGWDRSVRLWDVETAMPLAVLQGAGDWVKAVTFSPDGQVVAAASLDGTIRFWDAVSATAAQRRIPYHALGGSSVALSPDGRLLAVGASRSLPWAGPDEQNPQIRDLYLRRLLGVGPDQPFVGIHPDLSARLFDVRTGQELHLPTALPPESEVLAFSPLGKVLVAARRSGPIGVYDAASGARLRELDDSAQGVGTLAFSPDGECLAATPGGGAVRLWSISSGKKLREFPLGNGTKPVLALTFSPDGSFLAADPLEGASLLWEVRSGQAVASFVGEKSPARFLGFTQDRRRVAGVSDDGIRFWTLGDWKDVDVLEIFPPSPETRRALSSDGQVLALADEGPKAKGTLHLWDTANSKEIRALFAHDGGIQQMAFLPHSTILATLGPHDGMIRFWDGPTGQILGEARVSMESVSFRLSANGAALAVLTQEGGGVQRIYLLGGVLPDTIAEAERQSGLRLEGDLRPLPDSAEAELLARYPAPPFDPVLADYWRALYATQQALERLKGKSDPTVADYKVAVTPLRTWLTAHPEHRKARELARDLAAFLFGSER